MNYSVCWNSNTLWNSSQYVKTVIFNGLVLSMLKQKYTMD